MTVNYKGLEIADVVDQRCAWVSLSVCWFIFIVFYIFRMWMHVRGDGLRSVVFW